MGGKDKTGDDEMMDFVNIWGMVAHICHAAQKTTSLSGDRSEVEKNSTSPYAAGLVLTTKFEHILPVSVTLSATHRAILTSSAHARVGKEEGNRQGEVVY